MGGSPFVFRYRIEKTCRRCGGRKLMLRTQKTCDDCRKEMADGKDRREDRDGQGPSRDAV